MNDRKLKSAQKPEGTLFILSLVVHNNEPFSIRFMSAKMLCQSASIDKAKCTLRQLGDFEKINIS